MRSIGVFPEGCREGAARELSKPCLPGQPIRTPAPAPEQGQQVPPAEVTPTTVEPPVPEGLEQAASGPLVVFSVVALLALVLCLIYAWTRSRNNPRTHEPPPARRGAASSEAAGHTGPYDALVQGLIGTYDLSESQVVRAHVEKSLRGAGITAVVPAPGDPFDASVHNGVAGVSAPEPGLAFHIARVLRPGWRSTDGVLRPPDVEVFR